MTERDTSSAWSESWMEAQRKYWDAWLTALPAAPPQARDFFGKMVDQGKAFFRMSEGFASLLQGISGQGSSAGDWQDRLKSMFPVIGGDFKGFPFSGSGAFFGMSGISGMPGSWELPLDTSRHMERLLSVPALGYTREWQEQVQEGARLWIDYQTALQSYSQVFNRLGVETLDRLSWKLTSLAEKGRAVTSLRGLYDLWVDCAEEAHGELVATDEYAEIYGRLVNALMALKNHGRNVADQTLGAVGMPTRKGLNTVQRRQQELSRQLTELREEVNRLKSDRAAGTPPAAGKARARSKPKGA